MMTRTTSQDHPVPVAGIVLSRAGSDGTAGLRTIMAAGGVTLVQEPGSAKYTGMPPSATEAGVADVVLTAWRGRHAPAARASTRG
ncbi:CheB methylesterase [Halomonas shengliensis]|uniref:protein-glutamate methylesterase n=1 Tax=Halomonas shengliensis TaxID=419597 RepID=A0A1H0EV05_9GAMM|nr:chemotaxis protein CheB [Halomonas shengliensis]SDN86185.1 CheB methylesterase [Halomonas shengliensis]